MNRKYKITFIYYTILRNRFTIYVVEANNKPPHNVSIITDNIDQFLNKA